jgi:hypothetical protein
MASRSSCRFLFQGVTDRRISLPIERQNIGASGTAPKAREMPLICVVDEVPGDHVHCASFRRNSAFCFTPEACTRAMEAKL